MLEAPVRFSAADLDLFGDVSRDRNPLHSSAEYAHRTVFGQRVVFGVLGGLACLGRLGRPQAGELASFELECRGAMLADIDYTIEVESHDGAGRATARLSDGQQLLLSLAVRYREARAAGNPMPPAQRGEPAVCTDPAGAADETLAATPTDEQLLAGPTVAGAYAPAWHLLPELERRLGLEGIATPSQVAAILWTSYVAGMKLPGRRALLFSVSLELEHTMGQDTPPLSYQATAVTFDPRFRLLETSARLSAEDARVADAKIKAFVREDIPPAGSAADTLARSKQLESRVALVIGASRGLGAAIARALAAQGCTVIASYAHSTQEAEQLRKAASRETGEIILRQGDARDIGWCRETKRAIVERFGKLDFLVCNATPALLPLWLDESSAERITTYLASSIALVSNPMAVLIDLVGAAKGQCVVVSSVAVQDPPPEWPHYVAAKCAIEGLARTAAVEYPQLGVIIMRPPRLLTALTNTPLANQEALAPTAVADALVRRLLEPHAGLVTMEDFA